MQNVLLAAVLLLAGCLVTACAQNALGAVTASSPSAGAPATATAPAPPTPTVASPTPAPSTASPTVAPSTAATTPSPTPSSSSGSTAGFGNLTWLWFVLGALVLVGIILLATLSPARRRAGRAEGSLAPPVGNWHSRAVDAYAKSEAFDGAVRAAERQGVFTEAASFHWADIQRRADDLTETLYAMRETAPSEHRRVQVENAILALRAVRDTMDAQRAPRDASAQRGGVLLSQLSALESALNALRVSDNPLG
jgi:hypothetical protein